MPSLLNRIGLIHVGSAILVLFGLLMPFSVFGADDTARAPSASGTTGNDSDYTIEKKGNTTIKYKKKTTYDFEGANIDGLYNKPSGSYISNIKDVKGRSIIRIRENFDVEVSDSVRQMK